jgi:hypothetical protein
MASLQQRLAAFIAAAKGDFNTALGRISALENSDGGNSVDGGSSSSVYTAAQSINGGDANG